VGAMVPWIKRWQADVFFGAVIVANGIFLALDVEVWLNYDLPQWNVVLYVLQALCTAVFVVELLLRLQVDGCRNHCRRLGNVFDAVVVLVSIIDLWIVTPAKLIADGEKSQDPLKAASAFRVLQLLRLLRVVRLLRVSRELSLLVLGLVMSVRSVFWVFLLLFLFMYTGALFCMTTLGASDIPELKKAFGSVGDSLYSHFKLITLEAWPDINRSAMEESKFWGFYFVMFIMIMNLALVNLVIGVIMEGVMSIAQQEGRWLGDMHGIEAAPFLKFLIEKVKELRLGSRVGSAGTVEISGREFGKLLDDPIFQEVLWMYGISLKLESELLFEVIDQDGKGSVSVEDLAAGLLELRGSAEEMHPVLVRRDLQRDCQGILGRLRSCEDTLSRRTDNDIAQLQETLQAQLRSMQEELQAQLPLAQEAGSRAARLSHSKDLPDVLHRAAMKVQGLDAALQSVLAELDETWKQEALAEEEIEKWKRRSTQSTQTDADAQELSAQGAGLLRFPTKDNFPEKSQRRRRNRSVPVKGTNVRKPSESKRDYAIPMMSSQPHPQAAQSHYHSRSWHPHQRGFSQPHAHPAWTHHHGQAWNQGTFHVSPQNGWR